VGCVTQYGLVLANVQPWHTRPFIIGGAVVLVYFVGTSLPAYLLSCHDFQHCVAFAAQKPTNWSKSPHIYVGQEIDAAMRNIALWMITVIALTGSAATVCTTGSANAEPPGSWRARRLRDNQMVRWPTVPRRQLLASAGPDETFSGPTFTLSCLVGIGNSLPPGAPPGGFDGAVITCPTML
jgi:hypothetical protein